MPTPYKWIVVKAPDMRMHCKRCGVTLKVSLPIAIDTYVGCSKVFVEKHKECGEIANVDC
jgi:hypothetical protein